MARGIFQLLLPTPSYLRMPSVGLDISDKSIRFLGLREKRGALVVDRYAEDSLEPGIVEQGKIKDARRMREVLSAFREKHGLEFVRVSLPEEQAYLFRMDLPLIKKKDLRESVLLQLEEHVPLKATEAVFDYEIVTERADGFGLQVSVIPQGLAKSYADLFIESGLTPMSFEIEAQAIARAVVARGDKGTYMVVDFGKTRTGVSVVSDGVVAFTSTIEIGGSLITEAIAKELSLSYEEADALKRERGLLHDHHNKEAKEIFSAIISTVATLRDDINKHYIYWHTHQEEQAFEHRQIEKLILCGGDSNLKGLADYLASSMRVKVELADVWANMAMPAGYLPEITFSNSLTYATAIGLVLADTIA